MRLYLRDMNRIGATRTLLTSIGLMILGQAIHPTYAADAATSPPIKMAVFDFELQDATAAASLLGETTSNVAMMDKVSSEARRMLAESGRYRLVDVSHVDAKPVKEKSLRNCEGCEAGIALQLGADQSLLGVVTKVTQTDYYISIQISDARTGKVLDRQEANFAGADDGWASGVRMLIKHQVLVSDK